MSATAKPARDRAARPDPGFAVEPTAIGLQALVPGVVPITTAAPLGPARPQRPCDLGLFDLHARNQLDLFQPRHDPGDAARRPRAAACPKER